MQQLLQQARTQRHPPLALVSHLDSHSEHTDNNQQTPVLSTVSSLPHRTSQHRSFSTYSTSKNHGDISSTKQAMHTQAQAIQSHENEDDEYFQSNMLAIEFQRLLQTQRTTPKFSDINSNSSNNTTDIKTPRINIGKAMSRAIQCAIQNRTKTDFLIFHRMLNSSEMTDKIIDISYNVSLQNGKSKEHAWNKREKWRKTVSGYIAVSSIGGQPKQVEERLQKIGSTSAASVDTLSLHNGTSEDHTFCGVRDDTYWYGALPFQPPQTERQLEDYAAATIAIQNIQLSLHAENLVSKWSTGPIIKCRAFRSLLGCEDHDFIAGLIMIGMPKRRSMDRRNNGLQSKDSMYLLQKPNER